MSKRNPVTNQDVRSYNKLFLFNFCFLLTFHSLNCKSYVSSSRHTFTLGLEGLRRYTEPETNYRRRQGPENEFETDVSVVGQTTFFTVLTFFSVESLPVHEPCLFVNHRTILLVFVFVLFLGDIVVVVGRSVSGNQRIRLSGF